MKKNTVFFLSFILIFSLLPIPHIKAETNSYIVDETSDDVSRRLTPDYFSIIVSNIVVGHWAVGTIYQYGGGMRFTDINLPKGAKIISAYLNFTAIATDSVNTVNSRISGDDVDNATTFSTVEDFDNRYAGRTTARIDWDAISAWTMDKEYSSPDIKTIIQEIVDREGWSYGNAIALFWEDYDNRSTAINGCVRRAYSFDGSPEKAVKLLITWLSPPSDPNLLFGAGFNASSPYVELYWNHSLVNVQFFEVQSSSDADSWTYLGQSTTANYTDTQVANGTKRYYKVRACNKADSTWYNSSWTDVNFEKVHFILGNGEFVCVPQFFNASSIEVIVGTLNDGNLGSTYFVDGDWYNVSEVVGTPGIDIRVNFTDVGVGCGCFEFFQTFTGHPHHDIEVQIWNFTSTSWTTIGPIFFNETANWACIGLGHNYTHFFDAGKLYARFYHEGVGHVGHELHVERIDLSVIQTKECPGVVEVLVDYSIIFLAIGLIICLAIYFLYSRLK